MCGAAAAALWAVFAVVAWLAQPLHDDWYQRGWLKPGGLDLALVARIWRYNYLHANPRIGDVFLLMVNGPRAVHVLLSPLAQLALLWAAFVVAFGARPRLVYRDLVRALVLQVAIWLVSPIPGVVYFYRPFATNYLFAFATTLALIVPYRLALAGRDDRARIWLAPVLLGLGWLAGMSNEHTGPTAIVALAGFVVYAWRERRLRVWMIAGALGLVVGYVMLLTAPGQAERYAGRAARYSALGLIASRGVAGNYDVLAGFVGEAQWAIDLVIAGVLGFVYYHRKRGLALPAIARGAVIALVALVAASGSIVVTLFASPVTTERLLFAPAVLLAGALAVIVDHVIAVRRLRVVITWACGIIFAYHAVRFVQVYAAVRGETQHRLQLLAAAPPGSVAVVPAYRTARTRWFRGDDFKLAEVREYVAHELYGLAAIDFDDRPSWAEPTPPGRYVASRTYDPPLPPALEPTVAMPAYASGFVGTALMLLRQKLVLGGWRAVDGHALTGYRIDAAELGFDDPKHRPVHVVAWSPREVVYIDGESYEDEDRQPAIRIWAPSLPPRWTDAYAVGCGQTTRVEPRVDPDPPHDVFLPLELLCRDTYTGVICDPDECWLAGRLWH